MIYTKKMGGVGSGYILKVEASQFPNKLDMVYKRGKDGFKVSTSPTRKKELMLTKMKITASGTVLKIKIRVQVSV